MTAPPTLRPGERVFSFALLALGLFTFHEAYEISGFSGLATGGVMPMLAAGVMVVSGAVNLVATLRKPAPATPPPGGIRRFLVPARLLWFTALLILYGLAIPRLGFLEASVPFLFLTILFLWRHGVIWATAISLGSILVIYAVFRILFQVMLPTGTIWSSLLP